MLTHAGIKNDRDNANAGMNAEKDGRSWKTYLWGVLGLTVLLRVSLLLLILHSTGIKGIFSSDTPGYVAPIQGLMHGSFSTENGPEILRTPGYPIFLMLTGMADNHPLLSISCQIMLACFSVFLVYQLGMLLFLNVQAATLCAVLYAIEPTSVFYSIQLLTETLFTTILLVFIYQLLSYILRPSWGSLIWAALALSATVYVRPASYYLPLFCAVGLTVLPLKLRFAYKVCRATAFLAICTVLIGLWQVRNYAETGYGGFSSLAEHDLYYGQAVGILANKEHTDYAAKVIKLERQQGQEVWADAHNVALIMQEKHDALRIIKQNPVLFVKLQLRGMVAVVLDPSSTHILKRLGLYPSIGYLNAMTVNKGIPATLWWVLRNKPLIFIVTIALGGILGIYYVLAVIDLPQFFMKKDVLVTLALIFLYSIHRTASHDARLTKSYDADIHGSLL